MWLTYTMEDLEREPAATGRLGFGSQMRSQLTVPISPKRLDGNRQSHRRIGKVGGRDRVRTCDLMLAKHALSQLSYTPTVGVPFILKHFSQFQNPFPRI